MTITFTISGAPRTKKTSQRIVQVKGRNGSRSFTKILPSVSHGEWFKHAMTHACCIRQQLRASGVPLPIEGTIGVSAIFYRDRDCGDLLGYEQALADWLQEPKVNQHGKQTRGGAGIIRDDVQIKSWDGSRLAKDARSPRIEAEITLIEGR